MSPRKEKIRPVFEAQVEKLDAEGRGVARRDGKVVFIQGALPGETVTYEQIRNKPSYEIGIVREILTASELRVEPACPNFGIGPGTCGGCVMQHLDARAQVDFKQTVLTDALWHIGKVTPESILPPIVGEFWGYRHRARLTVRNVAKKGGILVGFHEKSSSYVADMTECRILPQKVSDMLPAMRELVGSLTIAERLPQIEVAVDGDGHTALVLRILEPLTDEDTAKIEAFAQAQNVDIWLQPKGPDSAYPMHPQARDRLKLKLEAFDVAISFKPTDFTQVNHRVNREMVSRAIELLDVKPEHHVADFFCGLGNFTLLRIRDRHRRQRSAGGTRSRRRCRQRFGSEDEFCRPQSLYLVDARLGRFVGEDGRNRSRAHRSAARRRSGARSDIGGHEKASVARGVRFLQSGNAGARLRHS